MASRHVMHPPTSARLIPLLFGVFVLACAAYTLAMTGPDTDGRPAAVDQAAVAPTVHQPVSQEGRLVAVTPTSVTAESVGGFARTYLIDSQTSAITVSGSVVGGAGTTFAVNDEVSIVGVLRDGMAVATAVAHRDVTQLNGPPMDAV